MKYELWNRMQETYIYYRLAFETQCDSNWHDWHDLAVTKPITTVYLYVISRRYHNRDNRASKSNQL